MAFGDNDSLLLIPNQNALHPRGSEATTKLTRPETPSYLVAVMETSRSCINYEQGNPGTNVTLRRR